MVSTFSFFLTHSFLPTTHIKEQGKGGPPSQTSDSLELPFLELLEPTQRLTGGLSFLPCPLSSHPCGEGVGVGSLTRAEHSTFSQRRPVPPGWPVCLHSPHCHERVHADPHHALASVVLSTAGLSIFPTPDTGVLSFLKRAWAPCGCGGGGTQLPVSGSLGAYTLELSALLPPLCVAVGVWQSFPWLSHSGTAFNLLMCPPQDSQHFRKRAQFSHSRG